MAESKKKHIKHPPLVEPILGNFSKTEFGFYGSSCDVIDSLMESIVGQLNNDISVYIVDADHKDSNRNYSILNREMRIESSKVSRTFDQDFKFILNHPSICLINGNHYQASKQIVIIDPKKESSLLRRKDQLTDVGMILYLDYESALYPWLDQHLQSQNYIECNISDLLQIKDFIYSCYDANIPHVKALILAGGKSLRMGKDKSQLKIHGMTQELYLANLCKTEGLDTYISKQNSQDKDIDGFKVINDRFLEMGPFGAICSALLHKPNAAWLVLACDLPFIDKDLIKILLNKRNHNKLATALKSKQKSFPEPLMTIYEPSVYQRMLQFLTLGHSCPRKVLINSDIEIIELDNEKYFSNINTPEDLNNLNL